MKITIEVPDLDEDLPELYYTTLADKISQHISELTSLGNFDEVFVAVIYRKVADAIEEGLLDGGLLASSAGASLVKEGFLEAMHGGGGEEQATEIDNYRVSHGSEHTDLSIRKKGDPYRSAQLFWEAAELIHERKRLSDLSSGLAVMEFHRNRPFEICEKMVEIVAEALVLLPKVIEKADEIAKTHGCLLVDDVSKFLLENGGYIDASRHALYSIRYADGIPVMGWPDLLRFDYFEHSVDDYLEDLIVEGRKDAFLKILEVIKDLPPLISFGVKEKLAGRISIFDNRESLEVWIESELDRGLSKVTFNRKVEDDFSALAEYLKRLYEGIEFMFPGRQVVRKQRLGRLSWVWAK